MLYEKIKILCDKKGWSIGSVEREAGLGNGAISKWKNSIPSVTNLKKVADVLGCTVDELLQGEEESEVG